MCDDWMLAPAEVPPTTAPRSWARTTASPTGVPQMTADSLSWLPPVMKTPVASSTTFTRSGSWALLATLGAAGGDLAGPQPPEQCVVHLDDLVTEAGGRRDHHDPGVGAAATRSTKSFRMMRLPSLSSAPPMIIRGPGRTVCAEPGPEPDGADGGCCSSPTSGMTGKASRCQSAGVREQSEPPVRQLVVMRHAKAEPGGDTDHSRELAQRGWNDALDAGRWLADRGLVPDGALVSSARRTTSTWLAVAEGGSFDAKATSSDSLYNAGPETALDLVRETSDDVDRARGDRAQPDHRLPRPAARRRHRRRGGRARRWRVGFPTGALAVFEVTGSWTDLELASARLVAFHVGRA